MNEEDPMTSPPEAPTTEAGRRLQAWLASIGSFGPSFDIAIIAIEDEEWPILEVGERAKEIA